MKEQISELPVFEIRPSSAWRMLDLRELWTYRELVYFLTWRDIKVRYKQTAIGIAWALLQPLAIMVVFTIFVGKLAGVAPPSVPYPVFALAAQRLITRVYFPRIIVPIATTLAAAVDFLVSAVLLAILMLVYRVPIHPEIVFLPAFVLLLIIAALGVGFWLSALNVEYRDVAYTMPFLNQFWFFITPVVYPITVVPENLRVLYGMNPMVGVVEGFRWALLGTENASATLIASSTAVAIVLFLTGIIWFRRRERTFVDAIGSGGR